MNKSLDLPHCTFGAWAEVNLTHLCNNARILAGKLPAGATIMAVVKADGYGHGAVAVSHAMNAIGVTHFGVANLAEGVILREAGIQGEILIFGWTSPDEVHQLQRHDLTQTVIDPIYAEKLLCAWGSGEQKTTLKVQLKINTGMHRYGISSEDTDQILAMLLAPHFTVTGIYTHLSACDIPTKEGQEVSERQIARFEKQLDRLRPALAQEGRVLPHTHLQSSYGVLNYPGIPCDMARVGIALYGAIEPGMMRNPEVASEFSAVLSVKARVALLREIPAGESAGYGLDAYAKTARRLALLSIGYADGVPRNLNKINAWVSIHGMRAPIVGRICMDCLMVDVTAIEEVQAGDVAVLMDGEGGMGMDVVEMARQCGTIPNEIVSRLSARLPKIFCS